MTDEAIQALEARAAMFEQAAAERLEALERADALLKAATAENEALRAEALVLRAEAEQCREQARGAREVAVREQAASQRLLELENEGLLDSILRHWRRVRSGRG